MSSAVKMPTRISPVAASCHFWASQLGAHEELMKRASVPLQPGAECHQRSLAKCCTFKFLLEPVGYLSAALSVKVLTSDTGSSLKICH